MTGDARAEELFARFLAREEGDVEALVAEHPELAGELRELARRWAEFAPRYESLRAAQPAREVVALRELVRRLGVRGTAAPEEREELGSGGMGRVVRAWDPDLERELALKVAREPDGEGAPAGSGGTRGAERRAARFLAEARVTGRLQHPGIVPIHALGLDARGRLFYTMPLIEGEDLERVYARVHAREPGWSVERVLALLLRACETMAYAHSRGVVHGDLKPANVRVGRFGEVYVMDWGLARAAGTPADATEDGEAEDGALAARETLHSRVVGTPAYLAPECLAEPRPPAHPTADVYALGAMLYRLVTGRLPREAELAGVRDVERLGAVLARPHAAIAPKEAAPELVAITERALATDPAARYPDLGALAEDLRAFLEDRVVRAYATGPLAELRKWVARNKATAAASIALVASLALGLAVGTVLYRRARDERAAVLRLADGRKLDELIAAAGTLVPALPERLAALDAWLADARLLTSRLPQHRATLAALAAGARADSGAAPVFASDEARWHHDMLAALVRELEAFSAPGDGLVAAVERRRAFASTVEERTLDGADARARWDAARRSIADPAECPAYGGLALAPQLGLVPLARSRHSGLWEFAHLASGAPPALDADGDPVVTAETGIVLVLLPGGTFTMGAQADEPAAPNHASGAFANEAPVHAVTLAPFFVAKHELTQAQWLRASGANPSTIAWDALGAEGLGWSEAESLVHPVETVSRGEAARVLAALDLELPTEAQWEYAARAGTTTPWWTGAEPASLAGAVNLADVTVLENGGEWPQIEAWLDDGFYRHAPVDALAPNPFGLHHVLGNVWEWCRDDFGSYALAVRAGDGLRVGTTGGLPVGRGGGYVNNAAFARASLRDSRPDAPHSLFGARAARAVRP